MTTGLQTVHLLTREVVEERLRRVAELSDSLSEANDSLAVLSDENSFWMLRLFGVSKAAVMELIERIDDIINSIGDGTWDAFVTSDSSSLKISRGAVRVLFADGTWTYLVVDCSLPLGMTLQARALSVINTYPGYINKTVDSVLAAGKLIEIPYSLSQVGGVEYTQSCGPVDLKEFV